jgi:hypothetical protein
MSIAQKSFRRIENRGYHCPLCMPKGFGPNQYGCPPRRFELGGGYGPSEQPTTSNAPFAAEMLLPGP